MTNMPNPIQPPESPEQIRLRAAIDALPARTHHERVCFAARACGRAVQSVYGWLSPSRGAPPLALRLLEVVAASLNDEI